MAKTKAKENANFQTFVIPKLKMSIMQVPIRGIDGPLVCHNWSTKAIGQMLAKQMQLELGPLPAKDPEENFRDSLHVMTDGRFGFPISGFKKCIERAAKPVAGLTMTDFRQIVFIVPDGIEDREFSIPFRRTSEKTDKNGNPIKELFTVQHRLRAELVEIIGEPVMRMDMVRLSNGVADIRFRAEFLEWQAIVTIRYVANRISPEQILNLVNIAGNTIGIGEGRPQKTDMGWGRFQIDVKRVKEKRA